MTRTQLYWMCQGAGWSAWFVSNLGVNLLARPFDPATTTSLAIIGIGGLLGTHAFRTLARRRNWMRRSVWQLIPIAITTIVLVGVIVGSGSVLAKHVLYPEVAAAEGAQIEAMIESGKLASTYRLLPFVLMSFNMMIYTTAWMMIYLGTHLARRAAEAENERLRAEQAVVTAERDRLQSQVALTSARMRALEYQLNPHFLFNALNTVRALIHLDTPEADRAVTKLSGLLRRTLSAGREVTQPLQAELDLVQTYLDLEKLRFGDRLHLHLDVDASLLTVPVPALLVQTLVENAVKHGIARHGDGGEVAIRLYRCPAPNPNGAPDTPEGLCIRVENPAPEAWTTSAEASTGTGLRNARERLALLYGSAARLELGREGTRVVAEVLLPTTVPTRLPSNPLSDAEVEDHA